MIAARATIVVVLVSLGGLTGCHSFYGSRVYHCEDGGPRGISGRFDPGCAECEASARPCLNCRDYTPRALIHRALTCGAGCGEVYYDEWRNDPPCEKCDCDGQWTPHGVAHKPLFWRLRTLLIGQRFHDPGCGCESCGDQHIEWSETFDEPTPQPADAAQPPAHQPPEQTANQKSWHRRVGY